MARIRFSFLRKFLTIIFLCTGAFIFVAAASSASLSRQQTSAARTVIMGDSVDRQFANDSPHIYQIALSAGQYVQAFIQQKGVDLFITLLGPDGQEIDRIYDPVYDNGKRMIRFIASSDGNYRLLIRPLSEDIKSGPYQLNIEIVRAATDEDRTRARATEITQNTREEAWDDVTLKVEKAERLSKRYEEALQLWQSLDDKQMVGEVLLDMGDIKSRTGRLTRALELYEKAIPLFEQTHEGNLWKASALNNLADIYYRLGETRKALDVYLKSLELKKEGKSWAITQDNIGSVYHRLGEYQQALDHHQQALTIFRSLGERRDEAIALNNLAMVWGRIGDLNTSLEYMLQAQPMVEAAGDKNWEAQYRYNIGNIYLLLGDHERALESANQSTSLSRITGNPSGEADGLTLMCKVYRSLGDFEKAADSCRQALPMHQKSGDRPTEASTYSALGQIYEQTGDLQKAMEAHQSALALYRAISDPTGEITTLNALGQLALERGDLTSARQQIERAIEMSESSRIKAGSHQMRYTYMAGLQQIYESYVDLLMEMNRREPEKGYEQTALQFSERGRARSLLDLLTEAHAQIRQGADQALLEKERVLLERLTAKDAAWKRLRQDEETKSQADSIADEINDLTTQLQLIEAQIRSSSPRYAELTQPQSLTYSDMQQRLLDKDTVLLEFALGKKRSWLWAVTPTSISTYQLPARAEIEQAARKVYELLTARQPVKGETESQAHNRVTQADAQFHRAANTLSRMLLGPIAAQLGQEWKERRLLIVASGALEYIPFASLPIPTGDSSYTPLIAQHETVNLPSASVLSALRRETAGRTAAPKMVAVLADPVFESSDPRVLLARKRNGAGTEIALNARSTGVIQKPVSDLTQPFKRPTPRTNRAGFSRLPFSREEADAIASLVPASSLLKATDFQAAHSKATSGELSNYRIVHFATHGLLNSQQPELSGLLLSLIDEQGNPQDGFLPMYEIYNLRLPADLVVLSACQTALGQAIKGEGLVGLTRGFMYAGAQRVVASLWQVDDLATAELMERFYRGMLKEGLPAAAALRAAQMELMKEKRWSSPYFWAGFVIQGEWK